MESNNGLEAARQVLWRYYRREKRLPSYSEMCTLFGYSSKNGAYKLAVKLIEAGVISKDATGRLIPKQLVPPVRMAGQVQAGFPSPAEEELLDTLSLDEFLISRPDATFLLKVSGDSMINAGIHAGDLILVERGLTPKNGQVVLAQIDQEWTLKYFEKRGRQVRLIAANPKYPPLEPRNELTLGGVVKAVIRKYA